jgi:hypothetical protein
VPLGVAIANGIDAARRALERLLLCQIPGSV